MLVHGSSKDEYPSAQTTPRNTNLLRDNTKSPHSLATVPAVSVPVAAGLGIRSTKQRKPAGGNAAAASVEARLERIGANIDAGLQRMEKRLAVVESRQTNLESLLADIRDLMVDQRTIKGWYSPEEVAEILGKQPYTVREWCRWGRVNARKRPTGRGDAKEWEISHEELERIKSHGLLPIPTKY
jgi:hypothetical protein